MAQIYVFGRVTHDLVPKVSQKNSTYVCFYVREWTGKDKSQSYQVWAWGESVARLLEKKVQKDSFIWLTGTLELVDCTSGYGKTQTKIMKVYLANWGYIPGKNFQTDTSGTQNETGQSGSPIYNMGLLDGDREALPE